MSKQKARSTSKNRDNSMTSEESTETVTTSNSQENQESQDPSTELEARMRGYIDVAIRASTESIMQNMQLYMDQQARTQQEWNRQLMETVNQKLAQFEQVNLNNNNQTISGEQLTTGQHPCNSRQAKERIAVIHGFHNKKAIETEQIRLYKLWKAIALGLFVDLQEFLPKNLINNIKFMNEDTVLQTLEEGTLAIRKQKQSNTFESISEWLLAFKAYMDAVLIVYENREPELNTYRDHINELCKNRDIENEGRNFDMAAVKRSREEGRYNNWTSTAWYNGKEICLNWNRKTSNKGKSSRFKYAAQFKASRAITACTKPTLQSVDQTIEAQPSRHIPLTQEEASILAQLDPLISILQHL
ncbi:hypothetical protein C2G38_2185323 [Gigaspora rosea]|uniref:Uncharacterized protein n=1 Tax=Gigaspora rosea TaxID=44941 RepID=A0A397V928_9GLOM|nr:hypothetical protein C2G38_2185323 [Gigaspora rosea]